MIFLLVTYWGTNLIKEDRCDLCIQFKQTIFNKHIFNFFSQTAAQILKKFGVFTYTYKLSFSCLFKSSVYDLFIKSCL